MSGCKKVRVLTDVQITVDPPEHCSRWAQDQERIARNIERWAAEFHDFIRDHRSQDPIQLNVERVYEDQCSECSRSWEVMEEEGVTYCAHCGAKVATAESQGQHARSNVVGVML